MVLTFLMLLTPQKTTPLIKFREISREGGRRSRRQCPQRLWSPWGAL